MSPITLLNRFSDSVCTPSNHMHLSCKARYWDLFQSIFLSAIISATFCVLGRSVCCKNVLRSQHLPGASELTTNMDWLASQQKLFVFSFEITCWFPFILEVCIRWPDDTRLGIFLVLILYLVLMDLRKRAQFERNNVETFAICYESCTPRMAERL